MRAETLHPGKLSLFTVLSFADLLLTWRLLEHGNGWLYESNPVAAWWLSHFGWPGMAAFKMTGVFVVAALTVVISRSQPRTGGWVLAFACSALGLVVLYSSSLAGLVGRQPDLLHRQALQGFLEQSQTLDGRIQAVHAYQALLRQLGEDLLAQRCTLPEAVAQLAGTENGRNPAWLWSLRRNYPGFSDEECLAANLVHHAVTFREADAGAARQLEEAYHASYGIPIPGSLSATPAPPSAGAEESAASAEAVDVLTPPLPRRFREAGPARPRAVSWRQ